jgi:hypothetical protein
MARLSLNLLIALSLPFTAFIQTALAEPIRGSRPPEQPDEEPPIVHPSGGDGSAGDDGAPAIPGRAPPFSEEDTDVDLGDLSDKIKELIENLIDLYSPSSTSSSRIPITAATTTTTTNTKQPTITSSSHSTTDTPSSTSTQLNAVLACEVYQSYTSLCPATHIQPFTSSWSLLPGHQGTETVTGTATLSSLADSARASCLCYSSSYYVPAVYDDAAWACAGYTGTSASLTAAATAAAETDGFCSGMGNVRPAAPTATFGQFTAEAAAAPSSTGGGTGKSAAAGRLLDTKTGVWVFVAAVGAALTLV